VDDEHAFMLAFLPAVSRQVTREGIVRDKIRYQAPALSTWVGATVLVRYNPLDLSKVFVKGPVGGYLPVPYRDVTKSPMTQWELVLTKESLKIRGISHPNEALIFDAVKAQRLIVEEATQQAKSKRARHRKERRAHADRVSPPQMDEIDRAPQSPLIQKTELPKPDSRWGDIYDFKIYRS
jgi:putative transposase